MPLWAILLFIPGFLYSIAFIANPAKQAALDAGMTTTGARKVQLGIFGFYTLYLAYASLLALNGVFNVNSVPPRVMELTAIPLLIVLFLIVGNTKLFKRLLRSITLESLISLHVFRLLGAFFLLLYFYHRLPLAFAFSSGLGDIITAILAVPVANRVAQRKPGSIKLAYAWSIFGALDIINLLVIAINNAIHSIGSGAQPESEMTQFPFVWFPAFAPATILFLHYAVFKKLHQLKAK